MDHQLSKRRRRMAPGSDSGGIGGLIPDDVLLFQILVLLPVKCLVRFQSVCKLWRDTITSTSFARQQLERSKTRSSMVIMPRRSIRDHERLRCPAVSFYRFQPEQSKVAELILEKRYPGGIPMFTMPLHCDGLIMIPCLTGHIFVCNPATGELVELPRGSHSVAQDNRVAFGFDPRTGKYKVARHFLRSYAADEAGTILKQSVGHEILTLGDGEDCWKWKATMDPPYPINPRTPICLPGFFYWNALHKMTGRGINKVVSHVILRFSLHDETFTVHPNPPCRSFQCNNDLLCELGGKLCYVYSPSSWDLDILLAVDDGPNLSWSLRCRLVLPIPRRLNVFACASLADRDKIFLSIDAWYVVKCDLRDGSLERIIDMAHDMLYDNLKGLRVCSGDLPIAHYMLPCVESLLRIRPCEFMLHTKYI